MHAHRTPSLADHLVRNPNAAQLVEDTAMPMMSRVMVVCDENRERLIDRGYPADQVTVVGNTPDLALFGEATPSPEAQELFGDDFLMIYVGAVDPFRGLDTVVEALPMIKKVIPSARLAILGKGLGMDQVKDLARDHGVADSVEMLGFRPLKELPGFISRGDCCLIPHHRNDHIDTTLPNKLFDYMALGRPVLTTDALPLQRIVEGEGAGSAYRSGDARSLADKVIDMKDADVRSEMGAKGRAAVRDRYNWGADAAILHDVFADLERTL